MEDDSNLETVYVPVVRACRHNLPDSADKGMKAIFFLRSGEEKGELSPEQMDEQVEYGVVSYGASLGVLEQMLNSIYMPMISKGGANAKSGGGLLGAGSGAAPTQELVSNMQKFASQVSHAVQQLSGDITLNIPDIIIEDADKSAEDVDVVMQLETAMSDWIGVLVNAIAREAEKTPTGTGPLAEIEFWREKNAGLSSLYEQLNLPNVRRMMQVVEKGSGDTTLVSNFRVQFNELTKLHVEAKDNVKFLTTLERHFKSLRDGTLTAVLDTLPPMMGALRMVWIISRHYSDDVRMGSLMERISNAIADKVASEIDVKAIFKADSAEAAVANIESARAVLEQWLATYLAVREKIEISGRDARWEFDRKRLFERTNYMATICGDLKGLVETVEGYKKFLGPELKAVTGDAQGIEDVVRKVLNMVEPIETLPYDAFDRRYQVQWEQIMAKFASDKEVIERATRSFIDTSFKKLRSAEGAFELLRNFKQMKTEGAIHKQMVAKTEDILSQCEKEIDMTAELFRLQKDNPPLTRNQSTVAGSINWSRSLFQRVKATMQMHFEAMEDELLSHETGQTVRRKYIELARAMMNYEREHFTTWADAVDLNTMAHLKQPIIRRAADGTVEVNFHTDLTRLIRETRYLDRMGFHIPETALNVSLQEDKYHGYVEGITEMLKSFAEVTTDLLPIEKELFSARLERLERVLDPGFSPLNWNSLGIPEFIGTCQKAIADFQSLVSQVAKKASIIDQVIKSIENSNIIEDLSEKPGVGGIRDDVEVHDLQEFFDACERRRMETVDELVREYRRIPDLLGKVEETVVGTNTGKSEQLFGYYRFFERKIYQALNTMVLNGMSTFNTMIFIRSNHHRALLGRHRMPPLFKIAATLSNPEITSQPPMNEVQKFLGRLVRNLVESCRPFVRWMDRSCIETPEQRPLSGNDDDEPFVFNFYRDIAASPLVIKAILSLNHSAQRSVSNVNRYLDSWRRHSNLWKVDRQAVLDRFAAKTPSCAEWEVKLSKYSKASDDVAAHKDVECDFILVSVAPLSSAVRQEALAWIKAIGTSMNALDTASTQALYDRITRIRDGLAVQPETLEELKGVLNNIAEVRSDSMSVELEYLDLEERHRTRELYALDFAEEAARARALQDEWTKLREEAEKVDESLDEIKEDFAEITQEQVLEFAEACRELKERLRTEGPGIPDVNLDDGLILLKKFLDESAEKQATRDALVLAEKLFDLPLTSYPELNDVDMELKNQKKCYDVYAEHVQAVASGSSMLWAELDTSSIISSNKELQKKMKKLKEEDGLGLMPLFEQVQETIVGFGSSLPLITDLKSDALRKRHWDQLMEITGQTFSMDPKTFTLKDLFALQLHHFKDEITEMVSAAAKELTIESEIKKLGEVWKEQRFSLFKKTGQEEMGYMLRSTEDIVLTLEDQGLNIQSMMASRFVKPFLNEVRKWEGSLSLIGEVIEAWMQAQRKWLYLSSIFIGSDDIRLQLPEEAKRFDKIDKTYKKIMADTSKNSSVLEACSVDGRLEMLQGLIDSLDSCQKSLSEYLDAKRMSFPRFYFLSDDELLSILGSSDPTAVQEHLLKLYDNCALFRFGRGNKTVTGMESSEGESYELRTPATTEGPVEVWMLGVEQEMRASLHTIAKEGVFYYATTKRTQWIQQNLGMVTLVGSQIWWTWETLDVFERVRKGDKHGMKDWTAKLTKQLQELTMMVRSDISKMTRMSVNQLIIIEVHGRDIIDTFVRDSIMDPREFSWESQLRFLWDRSKDDIVINQCTGEFYFGFEYMGLNGRLVITPLTDRCYMTLTTALTYRLGGAPAGPAGTGKTETTKDLAKSMALLCVVFNCGEGLDFKAMASIFSGLVQTGAWGCFDEFNRIEPEVLSVVSSQVKTIQEALKNNQTRFSFEGNEIALIPTTGIFITMNPGYAGRSELPDNLKALFRPVTMVVPDLQVICEIMLLSEGFDVARVLAKKMVVLYKLAREQLSKQYHYDFGLRALKSVLVMAGSLKRGSPDLDEAVVMMRALRDNNMPKFVFDDVPLFRGLISDLFPSLDVPRVRYETLNDLIENNLAENNYVVLTAQGDQVDKVVQLYETMVTRHTTMVVGQTQGGKSVIIQTLANAQGKMGQPTKLHRINPKAIPVSELYGVLDPETRDWTDGLLSNIFRELNKPLPPGKDERRYIVFDGDVDALWVENMNSVMDDNKLLTLPNGERIRLQNYVKLLFEVFDLQYASPATISRCGMVYVDSRNLGWRPFVQRWLAARQSEAESQILSGLFDKYAQLCLDFVLDGVEDDTITAPPKRALPLTNLNMITQLCNMLAALLVEDDQSSADAEVDPTVLESAFIYCLIWSIGSTIVQDSVVQDRDRFDAFVKKLSGMGTQDGDFLPAAQLPNKSLYDYVFNPKEEKWASWSSRVPEYTPPESGRFSDILVPTIDTVRSEWLLDNQVAFGRPTMFVGESGSAKTVTIAGYLKSRDPAKFSSLVMNFSSRTSSRDVQTQVEGSVEKRTKDTFGPPTGKKLIVWCDDCSMPFRDTYGTMQPIAMLKMLVERKGLYDRGKELNWKNLKDLVHVSSMGPPGGARNPLDPRYMSLFSIFEISFPSNASLTGIYEQIIVAHALKLSVDIQSAAKQLTGATLSVYNHIIEKLPPTPSRFVYIFNLRDLSRVYEGVLLSTVDKVDTSAKFVRLWRNEMLRVFHDRLISDEDRDVVISQISTAVKATYPSESEEVLADPILFGDYATAPAIIGALGDQATGAPPTSNEPRLYEDLGTYDDIKPMFENFLASYNENNKAMNLVFFEDALEHLTRVQRTLRLPFGNMLLVGVGGSGKQSLTRLSAYVASCGIFSITLTRGYDENSFREDLKTLYGELGANNKPMIFLFTDGHVAEEGFLESVNNMLTSGVVPGMYAEDEKEGCINGVREEVQKQNLPDSREALWKYYCDKCRSNLHVVLAMSPVGETLRTRCRNFPGLISGAVIDWLMPWPEQALHIVAETFLAETELPEKVRPSIVDHMVLVHQSARNYSEQFFECLRRSNFVTPKNYLDFVANYKSMLGNNRENVQAMKERLDGGLQKLIQAAKEVAEMEVELTEAKVVVDAKTKEVNELIEVITVNTADVEAKSQIATEKEAALTEQSDVIAVEKEDAEAALAEAIPALEAAADALSSLKKDDINEIKSFSKPPDLVQKVAECVVILKGIKDVSWKSAKALMSDTNFLRSLIEYDKDAISDKMVKSIKTGYMSNPKFNYAELKNVSAAGAGLFRWVDAMIHYNAVARTVAPKRAKVAEAEKMLRQATKDLAKTKEEVASLSAQLAELQAQFSEKNSEAQELKEKADLMEKRLAAASKLIAGLGSERERWSKDVTELDARKERLLGDCLLSSAFLSYVGGFTYDFRVEMVYDKWQGDVKERKIPKSEPFRVESLLTDDVEIGIWAAQGLPSDELSVQNGILTMRASRYALCIDPQLQAITWLKTKEGKQLEGKVKTFNDPDFLKQLELAVQYGFPFLFENCDEYIDPVIDPVVERNYTYTAQGKPQVRIGDKDVEVDPTFRLYMCTKLSNPFYGPEIQGKLAVINYSVTQEGLRDQLLNVTVKHERPDLEAQREELVKEMSDSAALLKQLEDTLLRELSNATGNILDNTELIATLEATKANATEISAKLQQATVTKDEIEVVRRKYTPAAHRGSVLFFVIEALSNISNMYEYSLGSYLGVFSLSLQNAKNDATVDGRLRNIIDQLTFDVYNYTCLGLFETHKLMFSFQMTLRILQADGEINPAQLDFFLKGNLSLEKSSRTCPYAWWPAQGWEDLMRLTEIGKEAGPDHPFAKIADHVESNGKEWQAYYDAETPEDETMPGGFEDKVNAFEKMCLMRCLRIDRVMVCVTRFVIQKMGERYVQPPVLDYNRIYAQTTNGTPVVFVLSPGADPAFDVFKLGEEMGFKPGAKLKYMALGQGMGPKAQEFLETGAQRGLWVMLQNCHLLPKWLKTMEKILERIYTRGNVHADFRVWLTTDPTDAFPLGVLQRSLKVVTEPPNGLKLNMRASYSKLTEDTLAECPHSAFRPLVYVLATFHAVVQERRKYGKLGWNVFIDFNETDFRISNLLISTYLTKAFENGDDQIPWGTLRYLIGEAMYGGRVADGYDRRILVTYLDEYLGDFLFDTFQPFFFYKKGDVEYRVPPNGSRDSYLKAIETLPLVQSPEVFGLHANADMSYYTNSARETWTNLVSLQPRATSDGGGLSREDIIANVARDVMNKVPAPFDMNIIRKEMGVPSPTSVVLLQELERYNVLLEKMKSSLISLQRALIGEIGMSADLDALGTSLFNGQLPSMWAKLNPETEKGLASWMLWFERRFKQYSSWVEVGEPAVMWLSGLHVPETYLAALVQTACRDRGWPLDKSTLYTKVTKFTNSSQVGEKLKHGCYIEGLYLEGAGWDHDTSELCKQRPKILVEELPILQLIPIEANKLKLANSYLCPVYVTQARRNAMGKGWVFDANLSTSEHSSHWVLSGVALCLNIT